MKSSLRFILTLATFASGLAAADLKPDTTTEIPASAKRQVVVTLDKSQISNLQSQIPKADLPPGYELQIAAASPLVTHPIMGCLDDRGRLFVGDATGVNWNKKQLEANPPNRILMLEDTNGDGIYDKSTVFADKMTFPQGGCWLDGSLFVCSPPSLWKLTDTDGDGVADQREELVTGFEYTGNAADVHGPWLHPNGRLYWCHGRKGHKVTGKDGKIVHEGLASGIWSCQPDGSDVQWHSLGCGDNPVKVDFTPDGEIIGVQNLYYSNPRGDTIVHWLYGGVYERSDQLKAIEGLPRTLEHMPVMYNFGHVAVSGCCFWRDYQRSAGVSPAPSDQTPHGRDARAPLQFLVTHFNTQRVVRMELTPDGATYKATEDEFLRLHDPDIHLTDVIEDADGSLIILNTGGWFRIGCPANLMAKPEVMGAVYRVRRVGPRLADANASQTADAYGMEIDWERDERDFMANHKRVIGLLSDERLFVRRKASEELVKRGTSMSKFGGCEWDNYRLLLQKPVIEGIRSSDPRKREAGFLAASVLGQIGDASGSGPPLFAPGEDETIPRSEEFLKALRWLPENGAPGLYDFLAGRYHWVSASSNTFTARPMPGAPAELSYAELCRIALHPALTPESTTLLFNTLEASDLDPVTEHAAMIAALRSNIDVRAAFSRATQPAAMRRLLLVAAQRLEQRDGWLASAAAGCLYSLDEKLIGTAADLFGTSSFDNQTIDTVVRGLLESADTMPLRLDALSRIVSAHITDSEIQKTLASMLSHPSVPVSKAGLAILANQTGGVINDAWIPIMEDQLAKNASPLLLDAIKKLKTNRFDAKLQTIANDPKQPLSLRLHALSAVKGLKLTPDTFAMLRSVLTDAGSSAAARIQAATMLAGAPLQKEQITTLAPVLASVGPIELKALLAIVAKCKDADLARNVATELAKNPVIASQQESIYRTALSAQPPDIFESIILPAYKKAMEVTEAKKRLLGPLAEKVIAQGDSNSGRAVYESGKGTCIACHQIGDKGRSIGPNLSKIGAIRTERDLLESILFPSNTLARDYEAHVIETGDGQSVMGVIKSHTAEGLLVVDVAGVEKNIPHPQIVSDTTLTTSLMPMGLDQTLPEKELCDLVAFLRSLK